MKKFCTQLLLIYINFNFYICFSLIVIFVIIDFVFVVVHVLYLWKKIKLYDQIMLYICLNICFFMTFNLSDVKEFDSYITLSS